MDDVCAALGIELQEDEHVCEETLAEFLDNRDPDEVAEDE